jgi:urea transport system permease protein
MTPFCGRLVAFALALAFFLAAQPAFSQTLDDAMTKFAADSFGQTEEGIAAVVATGSPRAQAIIEALQGGRLVFDPGSKNIFIRDGSRVVDAAIGDAVASPPADLKLVRINNRLRRVIEAAIGTLTLMSTDPRVRLSAAQSVGTVSVALVVS